MGLLDGLMGQGGGLLGMLAKNPQLVSAAVALLNPKDTSVGGSAGLGALVESFERNGLGDVMKSWVGTGTNQPIEAGALASVLGDDVLGQFASKAGLSSGQAGSALSELLPMLVDHLTPHGKVPEASGLEGALGSLLGGLG